MWWLKGGSEENHFDRPHHCCDFGPDLASKDSSPSVDWLDWKGFHVFQFCLCTIPPSMFSRLWTSSVSVFCCLQESSFVVWAPVEEGREFQVVRLSLRPFSSPKDENVNYKALFLLEILTLIHYLWSQSSSFQYFSLFYWPSLDRCPGGLIRLASPEKNWSTSQSNLKRSSAETLLSSTSINFQNLMKDIIQNRKITYKFYSWQLLAAQRYNGFAEFSNCNLQSFVI